MHDSQGGTVKKLWTLYYDWMEKIFFYTMWFIFLQACQDLCSKVPGVGRELWEAAFGEEDDENKENNFEGFSQDEM